VREGAARGEARDPDSRRRSSGVAGDHARPAGDPADWWWVLLEGRIELLRRGGHEEAILGAMDRPGVWAGGFRAWDGDSGYLATARAASSGRIFRLPTETLGDYARRWFPFGVHLTEGFFQTVRRMDSLTRQRESLIALGRLSAGLAHEINNPASATARAVDALQETGETLLESLVQLAERSLTAERFVAIDTLRREIDPSTADTAPIAAADREDAITACRRSRPTPVSSTRCGRT
jgi:signal transduction histidine kinase